MVNPFNSSRIRGGVRFNVRAYSAGADRALLSLGILMGLALCSANTGALAYDFEPSLKPGFQLIVSGQPEKALEFFNEAAREKADMPDVHLGRACALRFLSRPEEALKEYRLALLLNPSEAVARKCNEDIKAMERSAADAHKVELPQPSIGKNEVEKSVGDILRQSEERIKAVHKESENYATNIYKSSMASHYREMENIKRRAQDMSTYTRWGQRIPGIDSFSLQREQEARSQSRLKYARSDYEIRKREAQSKAVALKDAAEGLQSQMLQKPSETSGIYMVPNGTNLYVRNYAHFDPVVPEPPAPLQATAQKLPEVVQAEQAETLKSQKHKSKHKKHKAGK